MEFMKRNIEIVGESLREIRLKDGRESTVSVATTTLLMEPCEILMNAKSPFEVSKRKSTRSLGASTLRTSISSSGSHNEMSISRGSFHSVQAQRGMEKLSELNALVGLSHEVREKQEALLNLCASGKEARRRNREEIKAYTNIKSSVARSLWLKRKNNENNPFAYVEFYRNAMVRTSLPCHDMSPTTISQEAKLLKTNYNIKMLKRQLQILEKREQETIQFFYKEVLPQAQKDHHVSTKEWRQKVSKATKQRDNMVDLYEKYLGLQRKIIAKCRMRQLEEDNVSVSPIQLEAIKVAAGEVPVFEAIPKLRGSAERRIAERRHSMHQRQVKKKAREEVFIQRMESVDAIETAALKRAEEIAGEVDSLLSSLHQSHASLDSLDVASFGEEDDEMKESSNGSSVASFGEDDDEMKESNNGSSEQISISFEIVKQDSQRTRKAGNTHEHKKETFANVDDLPLSSTIVPHNDQKVESHDQKDSFTIQEPKEMTTSPKKSKVEKNSSVESRLGALRARRQELLEARESISSISVPRSELLERARSARLGLHKDTVESSISSSKDNSARIEQLKAHRRTDAVQAKLTTGISS